METTLPAPAPWSLAEKILFRFCCAYFVLYVAPFPLDFTGLTDWYSGLWEQFVLWSGPHWFGINYPISTQSTGSGDRTFDFVLNGLVLGLALLGTLVWSLFDRRRPHYRTLLYWLSVYVRYYLAFTLLSYGFAKVFKSQFPFPSPGRLMQSFGDASPMGLAWTFMGFSDGYNWFTGGAEVLGGLLLFFRRTTTLGALVSIGVMANVVAMNFCFDIPVKLYSTNLLLMGGFLLALDGGRALDFFLRNRPVPKVEFTPPFAGKKKWRIAALVFKALFIAAAVGMQAWGGYQSMQQWGDGTNKPPLYGLWQVETFVHNGDTLPPLTTDTLRWDRLMLGRFNAANLYAMDRKVTRLAFESDSLLTSAKVRPRTDTTLLGTLGILRPDSMHLTLHGRFRGDSVYVALKKVDENSFLLVNRGFHWINEEPFNR